MKQKKEAEVLKNRQLLSGKGTCRTGRRKNADVVTVGAAA